MWSCGTEQTANGRITEPAVSQQLKTNEAQSAKGTNIHHAWSHTPIQNIQRRALQPATNSARTLHGLLGTARHGDYKSVLRIQNREAHKYTNMFVSSWLPTRRLLRIGLYFCSTCYMTGLDDQPSLAMGSVVHTRLLVGTCLESAYL